MLNFFSYATQAITPNPNPSREPLLFAEAWKELGVVGGKQEMKKGSREGEVGREREIVAQEVKFS